MATASDKKILVVDDEPDVRHFLAACLEDAGFQVDTAVDGVDALEKVELNPPDLMTLDMVMPRKSGINVIRTLRKKEQFANLPVVVITAHAHDEFGSEDIKGFNAFASGLRPRYTFEKPISPEKLVNSICDILDVTKAPGADEAPITGTSDKLAIKRLIDASDPDTLNKIKNLLNK
ncbi:MAG: response regulator [Deltaproteobacteria bacterium]|nr:response regulator [Deltaproteobacteria bacterium]